MLNYHPVTRLVSAGLAKAVPLFALIALVALSGCASDKPAPDVLATIPQADAALPVIASDPYRLQIGDVLDIKFLTNPELDDQLIVRPDGRISTVVAQDVVAYGRTPYELQQALTRSYEKHLTDPKLAVIVRSYAPSRFYVLGEVAQPGEFVSVDPSITMLQALSRAGGLLNTADRDQVMVIRRGNDGKSQFIEASYNKATDGSDLMQDVRLANRDVVFVARTGVADVHLYYEQYLQRFISPSLGFSYQLNSSND